ncbi:MAG: HAD-IIA family hydrolase [Actinomycetes bacterium]
MTAAQAPTALPLPSGCDGLVLDLDGVVYRGAAAVPGSVEALAALAAADVPVGYATNNASRSPADVAGHLSDLGIPTSPDQVVTSAQVAAELLLDLVPRGALVLVVGGSGLREAVLAEGFRLAADAENAPAAVVQGFGPDTSWRDLAEATYAVRAGAVWIAANTDLTFPTERGNAPGNGTFVAAVSAASGCVPVVAGKPAPALLRATARRVGARRALVVGDRLDTDIVGAKAAGLPSALVLSGVTTAADLAAASADEQPDIVAPDLLALVEGRWWPAPVPVPLPPRR